MNTNLTQAQIDANRENGFIVIHDFLTAEELEIWRDAVDEAVAKLGKWKLAGQKGNDRWQEGDSYYDRVFVQRINLWRANQKVRKLMLDPRLGKMAAQLAGVEGIRLYHDQALNKAPWANPTAWHLDDPFWSFSSPAAISIWVALDDSTLGKRLSLLHARHTQAGGLQEFRHRRETGRSIRCLSPMGAKSNRGRADEGGILLVSQRLGGPCGRGQHDARLAAGDDLSIYARWQQV